jgi:hypothetical protein
MLLLDLFGIEQAVSHIFGEFVKQLNGGYPELVAMVIFKLIDLARSQQQQTTVDQWVIICLNNFLQVKPIDYAIWALTCLFLSASNKQSLQHLYPSLQIQNFCKIP